MSQVLIRNTTFFDRRHKEKCEMEKNSIKKWNRRFSWLPAEYIKLQQTMFALTKESKLYKEPPEKDPRQLVIRPFPKSTGHEIGWLAQKKEFFLEYGSIDTHVRIPILPDEAYYLF